MKYTHSEKAATCVLHFMNAELVSVYKKAPRCHKIESTST